jgi:hypothetical protein
VLDNADQRGSSHTAYTAQGFDLLSHIAPRTGRSRDDSQEFGQLAQAKPALFNRISPALPRCGRGDLSTLWLPSLAIRAAASVLTANPDLRPATFCEATQQHAETNRAVGNEDVNVSWKHLSDSATSIFRGTQAVFRKLPVFQGTFDAKAEEVICERSRIISSRVKC